MSKAYESKRSSSKKSSSSSSPEKKESSSPSSSPAKSRGSPAKIATNLKKEDAKQKPDSPEDVGYSEDDFEKGSEDVDLQNFNDF
jgi:hypothetical protein